MFTRPISPLGKRGFAIVSVIVALVLIAIILVAIMKTFVTRNVASAKLGAIRDSHRSASRQLYTLLGESWASEELSVTGVNAPTLHTNGNFVWVITTLNAGTTYSGTPNVGGLKLIQVWAEVSTNDSTAGGQDKTGFIYGYKYNDF